MSKKKLVVFTGAGVSAESGLQTFRDADGLWNNHRVEDVASPAAFARNPKLVLDFYNMRRRDVAAAQPNQAHRTIKDLEQDFQVCVITQNIDDLHERAGSTDVIHLHGEIHKMRTADDPNTFYPITEDIQVGDLGVDGSQLRPHVVWFEEPVPLFETALLRVQEADIFLVIGTSLQVYPAASLLQYTPIGIPIIIIDKQIPDAVKQAKSPMYSFENTATQAMTELVELLQSLK